MLSCYADILPLLQAALVEKAHLEADVGKLRQEQERTKQELEKRRTAAVSMQAALQQLQMAMQTVVSASGQL